MSILYKDGLLKWKVGTHEMLPGGRTEAGAILAPCAVYSYLLLVAPRVSVSCDMTLCSPTLVLFTVRFIEAIEGYFAWRKKNRYVN